MKNKQELDLIDRDWLSAECVRAILDPQEALDFLLARIKNAKPIDAVPVVRCRECIHRVRTNSTLGFSWCGKFGNVMRDTDFCSWGERKMDGGAE